MKNIKLKAYAKINLGLDVVKKRDDGYHEVRMIMQTINLFDRINIRTTDINQISLKTNLHYLATNESNLVYKAAKLIKDKFHVTDGLQINMKKQIPVSAGLAGGSADAAATLIGLNKLFKLGLTKEALMELGVSLGADVPYCILQGTALSEGIGEKLTPLPAVPPCKVLIVKPHIHVSTKFVYENLDLNILSHHPDIDEIIKAIVNQNLYDIANQLENVLETVTIKKYPVIDKIKKTMLDSGAMGALMSGSGPTVFGLYDNSVDANKAYQLFKSRSKSDKVFLTEFMN
jgi:4-diphosphocytidyl-2-C-methyl-D-erythritol kinase